MSFQGKLMKVLNFPEICFKFQFDYTHTWWYTRLNILKNLYKKIPLFRIIPPNCFQSTSLFLKDKKSKAHKTVIKKKYAIRLQGSQRHGKLGKSGKF